jgi:hypothetical protein
MRIWDKQDQVWLEREGVDAGEMLRVHSDRYSKTEPVSQPQSHEPVKPEPVQAAPVEAPPARKKPGRKPRILAALNGLAGKPAAHAQ